MADFSQTISDFLCNIAADMKKLRLATERDVGTTLDDFVISIPEKGGYIMFESGDTIINFTSGIYTIPTGEVVSFENNLSRRGTKYLSSLSITGNKLFHYTISGAQRKIINANYSDHINNANFDTLTVTCNQDTAIHIIASTHPHPDIGQSPNLKIDSDGRTYTKPVGSEELPIKQCCDGRILNLNEYQSLNKRSLIEATTFVGTRIGDSPDGIPDAAFGILQNAAILQPASAIQMELVSDDAADTQTIRLEYFDEATWTYAYEDVVLTGLTAVNTVATDIYRIDNMTVIKGGPAVGTITLKDTGAVSLYGQISPLRTFMERALHYVRTGYRCIVSDVIVGTQTKEGIIFRLFRSMQTGSDIVTQGRFSVSLQGTNMSHSFNISMVTENPDGLRMAVGVGVFGLAAAQGATSSFRLFDELI